MKCDAEEFAAMYSAVYVDMYRFALCMMKNPHDAGGRRQRGGAAGLRTYRFSAGGGRVQKLDLHDPCQHVQKKMAAAGAG